jgi:negative regulator of sigma E activity
VRIGLTLAAVAAAVIVGIRPVEQASTDRQLQKELYGAVSVLDTLQMAELEQSMLLDVRSLDALSDQVVRSLDSVQVDAQYMREVFGDLSSDEILEAGSAYLAAHDVLSTFDETSYATFDEQ